MNTSTLPIAVIGAGPIGLAAAAHLLARGETPMIFEAGAEVGANIRKWQHVRMFSPWEYTVDSVSVGFLEASGWEMPPKDSLPTGGDLVDKYMQPFAALPEISEHLHLNTRVNAISRRNIDKMLDAGRDDAPFVLHVVYGDGHEAFVEARAVIDASGTWHKPNPIGSGGLPAIGENRHQAHIFYGIPDVTGRDCERFAGKRVMVIGNGHSAINALLELAAIKRDYPQMQIVWSMRNTNLAKVYGGELNDALPARGALGTRVRNAVESGMIEIVAPFRTRQLESTDTGLNVIGETPDGLQTVQVNEIIATTGARPDLAMLRELRLEIDPSLESARTLAPMIDPNIHSCGTVRPHGEAELRHPEKDFYIVGMKSYGRAPTFLLATGYEQVRSVVAGLVGDWDAARDVQLNLPETGVCNTDFATEDSAEAACCGTSANVESAQPDLIPIADANASSCCGTGAETDCCTVDEVEDCCGTAVAQTEDCCGSSAVVANVDFVEVKS